MSFESAWAVAGVQLLGNFLFGLIMILVFLPLNVMSISWAKKTASAAIWSLGALISYGATIALVGKIPSRILITILGITLGASSAAIILFIIFGTAALVTAAKRRARSAVA